MSLEKLKRRISDRKNSGYDMPVYEEYFLRPISFPITNFLVKTNISPNQITYFSNLLLVVACFLYFYGYEYIGSSLVYVYFVLDCVDGEIARERKLSSKKGALLEEKLPIIFFVAFSSTVFYVETSIELTFLYLFSVHSINSLSFLNEPKESHENFKENNFNFLKKLKQLFTFVKSPFFMFISSLIGNYYVFIVIIFSFIMTFFFKLYRFWIL